MKKKQKIIIGACTVLCVGVIGTGIFFAQHKEKGSKEEIAYVMSVSSMNDMAGTQKLAGVVESQKTLDIQKDTEREVKEILVKTGDEVDVGTPLFTYDTAKLDTDLQQANLDLERVNNDMENQKAQIAQLEKEKKKAPEKEQLSYTTQIQSAQMDLKKSEYEKKAKEVEINRLKSQIENSTVTSEMKGVVKSINNSQNGESFNPYDSSQQAFITILATGEYRIKGKVNEQNITQIVEGAPAIIRSRVDKNAVWRGTYTAVDTKNPNNNQDNMMFGGGQEQQMTSTSYPFYVELESSEGLLLGQHVYIEQDTGLEEREEGIWLDEAFIADIDKEPYVWVESKKGTLEKRNVTLGTYDENMMQYKVEKGLKSSDYVAFPQDFFKEGVKTTHEMTEGTMGEIPMPEGEMLPEGEAMPEGEILPEGEALPEGEMLPEEGEGEAVMPEEDAATVE